MRCPYCKNEALWCDNSVVYGKRYGKSYMCWFCKNCDAYVGCHNNTQRPLGTMANKELRKVRIETHAVFDKLWKSKSLSRKMAYIRISDILGYRFHIGNSDIEQCKKIVEAVGIYKNIIKN